MPPLDRLVNQRLRRILVDDNYCLLTGGLLSRYKVDNLSTTTVVSGFQVTSHARLPAVVSGFQVTSHAGVSPGFQVM